MFWHIHSTIRHMSASYSLLLIYNIPIFILHVNHILNKRKRSNNYILLHSHSMSVRGFEPRTTWLKVKCSTTWATRPYLIISFARKMPRTGIEPVTRGFSILCSTDWAIWAYTQYYVWVAGAGFEPTTFGLWARRASRLLHPAILS